MNKILKLLDMTDSHYEWVVFEKYLKWCGEQTKIIRCPVQQILSNAPISEYFRTEYGKCETEFLKLVGRYENSPTVTVDEIRAMHNRCTDDVFNFYPKPLLAKACKLQIINEPTSN